MTSSATYTFQLILGVDKKTPHYSNHMQKNTTSELRMDAADTTMRGGSTQSCNKSNVRPQFSRTREMLRRPQEEKYDNVQDSERAHHPICVVVHIQPPKPFSATCAKIPNKGLLWVSSSTMTTESPFILRRRYLSA